MSSVLLERSGDVAEIVLNRPDKLNAVDEAMAAELLDRLREADGARALILRGEGRGFCAGRDLSGADPGEEDAEKILAQHFNPVFAAIADFPAPTFAALHGAALGVGLGIALACDVVYASDDAKVGSPFARIGAVLDSGAHLHFVRRVGPHRALELIYTGRLLSGVEAAGWGLVNRSVAGTQLLPRVRAMATQAAKGPTHAFVASKRLVRHIVDENLSLRQVLDAEATAQGEASRTDDYREGISAFQEKRTPRFAGR